MTTYGVTPAGFVVKPLEVIKAELQADFREEYGANLDLDEREPAGQMIGIMADRLASLWELGEEVYHSFTADGSVGVSLDNVAGITGTIRRPAVKSTVAVTMTGTPGTIVPAGRVFKTSDTGARFQTKALATIGGGGTVSVECESVVAGPYIATAGTLTVIETPVAGLSSITNPLDADAGRNAETDDELRLRRETELQSSGNAAVDAVKARVSDVDEVQTVEVFNNDTDLTDLDGMPPHSIEVLVSGGDDTEIAQAILASKAGGIQTAGSESVVVEDAQGHDHTIKFSRPEVIEIYVAILVDVDAKKFPLGGDQLVEDAVIAWAEKNFYAGRNVTASALEAQCFTVSGVLSATCNIGLAPSPATRSTIAIGTRQYAELDSTRTACVSSPVTP